MNLLLFWVSDLSDADTIVAVKEIKAEDALATNNIIYENRKKYQMDYLGNILASFH